LPYHPLFMTKGSDIAAGNPPKPFANSYWVEPGRLLAGEYPGGSSRTDPANAVEALLRARVNCFIDLTQEKEMTPYEGLLEGDAIYRRIPIVDHGVPRSPQTMTAVLEAINAGLEAGRCVYVHCRAGIGRTGMAIACYLIQGGLDAEAALERLQMLWQDNARSATWHFVPETDAQVAWVRRWQPAAAAATLPTNINAASRNEGAMLGLASGDAIARLMNELGGDANRAIAEISKRQSLATDAHTAMTIAVAESLLTHPTLDAQDHLQRYLNWTRESGIAPPAELKRALATWQWSRKTLAGSHDPKNLDGHSLPRTLAVVLFAKGKASAIEMATEVSRVTQQSPGVLDLCRLWSAMLLDALAGAPKANLLTLQRTPQLQQLRQRPVRAELDELLNGQWTHLATGGNAIAVTAAALLALQGATSFQAGMVRALTLSKCPAVTGPLYGALAGAVFGVQAIPQEWTRRLPDAAPLRALTRRLSG
jgi:ADP-ribosylglycohydrolase